MTVPIDLVAQVFSDLTAHGQQLAGKLQEAGIFLLTGLGSIVVAWTLLSGLLKENSPQGILAEVLPLSLRIGIVAWVIQDYVWVTGQITAGFDWVAAKLAGAQDAAGALQSAMASLAKTSQNVWFSFGTGDEGPGFWDVVKGMAGGATFWIKLLILVATLLLSAVVGAMFVVSQIMAGIAIAFGPVFLPWYIVSGFSWISNGWERFLLSACLMKVVGVVMLGFVQSMTLTLRAAAEKYGSADSVVFDVVGSIVILFVLFAMLLISLQIPQIAQGLVSGSASVNTPSPAGAIQTASQIKNLQKPGGGGGAKPAAPAKPKP